MYMLQLLVYEALCYWCTWPSATSVCGLKYNGYTLFDVYVYVYVFIYVYESMYMYAVIAEVYYICIHLYVCMYTHTHTHTHTYVCVCVCVCIYMYIYNTLGATGEDDGYILTTLFDGRSKTTSLLVLDAADVSKV